MSDFPEYEITFRNGKLTIEHGRAITFQGVLRKKWFLFEPVQLKDAEGNIMATFSRISKFSLTNHDLKLIIQNGSYFLMTIDFIWAEPHAIASADGREFKVIFHKTVMASVFENGIQIASLRIPERDLFRKPYKLTVRKEVGIDAIFWVLIGVIYKLDIVDAEDEDPYTNRVGPFQSELQPFDPYWKQG